MRAETYSEPEVWAAPPASGPLDATVALPGSKSLTNRELVLSALADGTSTLRRPLRARDTALMVDALRRLGTAVVEDGAGDLRITPMPLIGDQVVDCGLAGTLMRFLPPLAALADGPVRFDGDERARARPMATTVLALRALGVTVDDDGLGALPFTVRGHGRVHGGAVTIDASASSQFVSGLLLSAARFDDGLEVEHRGARLPSLPHIDMTIAALEARGVSVQTRLEQSPAARWTVASGPIAGRDVVIEPDLSNASPFLAAALVAGGSVTVPGWPRATTQVGDRLREWLPAFGAAADLHDGGLTVTAPGWAPRSPLSAVDLDLSAGGELAPTLVGLAALGDGRSTFTGIGHLRGHETDRLAALVAELRAMGCGAAETEDGLTVDPAPMVATDRAWHGYGDHRMVTTGALLGLVVAGLRVDDMAATGKTLPDFPGLWNGMLT